MSEQLSCHGSARCEWQDVQNLDGTTTTRIIHNIHQMQSDGRLEGFVKNQQGARQPAAKKAEWQTWHELTWEQNNE